MKKIHLKKGLSFLVLTALCAFFCLYGFLVAPSKIKRAKIKQDKSSPVILNLWHLDTFEGGTGSRKQFILSAVRQFEKQNSGVIITVKQLSKTAYLEQSVAPDILSYGVGIEVENVSPITVQKEFLSGKINGKTYALPWARGGYYLFSHKEIDGRANFDKITVSDGEFTSPLTAFYLQGLSVNTILEKEPLTAYTDFVTGQTEVLLGTQRDLNRLAIKGLDVSIVPLNSYSDLYQYISVTTESQLKKAYAEKFIDFLTSEKVQLDLVKIGMFSPFYEMKNDGNLQYGQGLVPKYTLPCFTDYQFYQTIKNGFKSAKDLTSEQINLKNLLINLEKISLI